MKTIYFEILLFISICFLTIKVKAQGGNPLNDYLQVAIENNPGLQASFQRYYAALERVPQVGALPDPKVMMAYSILPIETRLGPKRWDMQLSQSFPWFGTLQAQKDQASKEAEAQYDVFLQMRNGLVYQVKAAYYALYANQKSISITEDYLDILKQNESTTLNRVEAGKTTMADVLRVQMELKENEAQIGFFKDKAQTLTTEFNALLNRPPDAAVAVEDSLDISQTSMDYQVLMDSILASNPQLNSLRKQQEALDNKVEVARKSGMPAFGLGLNYAVINKRTDIEMGIPNDGRDMLMPTATLSIPLYRKKYKAMVKEVEFQRNGLSKDIENTQNSLQTELTAAINKFKDASRKVKLYKELLVQARQALNILTQSYIGGQESYEEVLRMDQKLLQYQLKLEQYKADLNTSVALVEKYY